MKEARTASSHYNADYFAWHSPIGDFGGWANQTKFIDFIRPEDRVLDFGCGGASLLKALPGREKLGIEVNPAAREKAASNGIRTVAEAKDVPDGWADILISNNSLEHALHPLAELTALLPKLRPGALAVFVVPCESIDRKYVPGDINHHLYSWSPMAIGNLFTEAGFMVESSEPYIHKWPPYHEKAARWLGRRLFEAACRIYGRIERSWFQVRVVARRPRA